MQEWVENLLVLQDKDMRITRLENQLKAVPGEIEQVKKDKQQAEEAFAQSKRNVQEYQKQLKNLDMEIEKLENQKREIQSKSQMIKDNQEYRAALDEIENSRKRVSETEDQQLEIMEALEKAKQEQSKREEELQRAQERAQEMIDDLEKRAENSRKQIESLRAEREKLVGNVPDEVLRKYERLRTSPHHREHGRVLVPIRDKTCDSCHMSVNAQTVVNAKKGRMVTCEDCGSLLYAED